MRRRVIQDRKGIKKCENPLEIPRKIFIVFHHIELHVK